MYFDFELLVAINAKSIHFLSKVIKITASEEQKNWNDLLRFPMCKVPLNLFSFNHFIPLVSTQQVADAIGF